MKGWRGRAVMCALSVVCACLDGWSLRRSFFGGILDVPGDLDAVLGLVGDLEKTVEEENLHHLTLANIDAFRSLTLPAVRPPPVSSCRLLPSPAKSFLRSALVCA